MLFSSLSFLYMFLPLVLIIYYLVPKMLKNAVLLVFSLVFYFAGEQELILLMLLSALLDFFCSLAIEHYRGNREIMRLFLVLSIVGNLSLLGYFKYANLVIQSINAILDTQLHFMEIALPIGISFYTFQTMSYTFDVYRGDVKAERNFLDFFTYVTLFPQLIAGPIVRYQTVADELKKRQFNLDTFGSGVSRFCVGLGKKILIANTLAGACKIYGQMTEKTTSCLPGFMPSPSPCKSTLIFPDIRTWRLALAKCSASLSRKISTILILPRALPNSGGAGI